MTKSSQFVRPCRQLLLWATVAVAITGSAMAQSAGTAKAAPASSDDSGYSTWDVTPFFGWQWFQAFQGQNDRSYTDKLKSGWLFGERFNADLTPMFSTEASLTLGSNRLLLRPFGQNDFASIPSKNIEVALHFVYHFQPRTAKTRLFVLAGPAIVWYQPGSTLGPNAIGNFVQPTFAPKRRDEPGITYGIGVKHYVSPLWGLRFDVGGRLNPAAHFNLPSSPQGPNSIYIPVKGVDSSLYASVGIILREHYIAPPPPPNPLISQALRVDVPTAPGGAVSITGAHDVCPGDDLRLSINASGFPNPTYQWRINGAPAAGATGASYSAPTATGTGSRAVTAVVTTGPSVGTSAPFATSAGHTYHLTAVEPVVWAWPVAGLQPISGW